MEETKKMNDGGRGKSEVMDGQMDGRKGRMEGSKRIWRGSKM